MRVKIGDTWYSPKIETPIAIELDEFDKKNIQNMSSEARMYAYFDDNSENYDSIEKRREWLLKGSYLDK